MTSHHRKDFLRLPGFVFLGSPGAPHLKFDCAFNLLRIPSSLLGSSVQINRLKQGLSVGARFAFRWLWPARLYCRPEVRPRDVQIALAHLGGRMAQQPRERHQVCPTTQPPYRETVSQVMLAKIGGDTCRHFVPGDLGGVS